MSVTVLQFAHSPFCIPITAALSSCGVDFTTREVSNADRSEILQITNGGSFQVPVLLNDDQVIFESGSETQDIAQYVNRTFAGGRLFPAHLNGLQTILIDYLENQVEGQSFRLVDPWYLNSITDPLARGMIIRHKERKFGKDCVEVWRKNAEAIRTEVDRLLHPFEEILQHSPYLFGMTPVYADYLLYGILGNLTYNGWNKLNPQNQASLWRFQSDLAAFRFASLPQ